MPRDDGKVFDCLGPSNIFLVLAEALELHGKLTFANLVLGEGLFDVVRDYERKQIRRVRINL